MTERLREAGQVTSPPLWRLDGFLFGDPWYLSLARRQRGSGCNGGLVGLGPGSAPDFPRPSPRRLQRTALQPPQWLSKHQQTALSSTAAHPPTASFNTNSPTAFSAFQRGPLSGPGHSPLLSRRAGENPRSDRACILCCCNNRHPCLRRSEGPAPTVIPVFFSEYRCGSCRVVLYLK